MGIWHSFEYREHLRPLRCILTICNHRDSTTCPKTHRRNSAPMARNRRNLPALLSEEARAVCVAETCGLTLHHSPSYSLIKKPGQIVRTNRTNCPDPLPDPAVPPRKSLSRKCRCRRHSAPATSSMHTPSRLPFFWLPLTRFWLGCVNICLARAIIGASASPPSSEMAWCHRSLNQTYIIGSWPNLAELSAGSDR